ncbi:hypothetical protein ACQKOH_20955 [Sphingomonas sp. NPDC092331]|jgi:hypothetical protein|uniref:hypothetical protein n=1 Tax=unclassified Sphingomonas TaxID=196159 RepID=UPI0037F2130B
MKNHRDEFRPLPDQQRRSPRLHPDPIAEPDDDMWRALIDFRARHGHQWKNKLTIKWMTGEDEREPHSVGLRRVRNHLGPFWLMGLAKPALDLAARRIINLALLPEMAATILPGEGTPIVIKRGEMGYWPMPDGMTVDSINAAFEATAPQVAAMSAGSIFGWHVPGANPNIYDTDGNITRAKDVRSTDDRDDAD